MYHAVLVFAAVDGPLARTLIRADANLLVLLGPGVVEHELRSDVAADRLAVVKQRDAVGGRSIEPIVRLTEHHRHRELHSGLSSDGELIRGAGANRTRAACANRCVKDAVLHPAVLASHELLDEFPWIAILGLSFKSSAGWNTFLVESDFGFVNDPETG